MKAQRVSGVSKYKRIKTLKPQTEIKARAEARTVRMVPRNEEETLTANGAETVKTRTVRSAPRMFRSTEQLEIACPAYTEYRSVSRKVQHIMEVH